MSEKAKPRPKGHMITTDVSKSKSLANLSPDALNLFFLLIPHFSNHGKILANPHYIKGLVCPFFDRFDIPTIERCLEEISARTNVKVWTDDEDGQSYAQSISWYDHQKLRTDRLGSDMMPDWPGLVPEDDGTDPEKKTHLQDHSRTTPGPLPHEVEVEVEVEVEDQPKGESGKAEHADGWVETAKVFTRAFTMLLGPIQRDKLRELVTTYGKDKVIATIEDIALTGTTPKAPIKYLEAALKNAGSDDLENELSTWATGE